MKAPAEIIRREIAERGVLSFARFMELALYCPNSGYYETKKDNPGRRGDFYTSVSAGGLFGQLLAFQFAEWLEEVRSAKREVRIVEAGAHDGQLARDILTWLQWSRPKLFEQIEYGIIEPSARRREWQSETLKNFAPHVRWFDSLQSVASKRKKPAKFSSLDTRHPSLCGIIFSNELLDAMPVHRFGWDAAKKLWFEWGVSLENGNFVWTKIQNPGLHPPSSIFHLPSSLLDVLPDGYTIETCPAAENWWREAANILERGRLLTIDYGLTNDELFSPGRTRGTLRAYFRHHATDDLLANVGEQDLTAHVNFSVLQSIGEACGLTTETFSTQAQFLTRILEKTLREKSFGEWTSAQARQFQTLTHPEHLGRAFRVLIQSRQTGQ
ncbi:MAG: SAM-dependent methyltransferase [Verrucomicrobiota bacterium]|jgi:SAM-dependent MidA family methyltransferase